MDNTVERQPSSGGSRQGARSFDLYSEITRQIIEMLDKGVVPWRSPILGLSKSGYPRNLDSGKPYRGVNVFLLAFMAYIRGFGSSYWMTFRQAQERGGNVKKGEKSSMVVFWKQYEVEDKETREKKKIPILRYYNVFNAEQCEGIKPPDAVPFVPNQFQAIEAADSIVKGYENGPAIEHCGQQAYYKPSTDIVKIPEPSRFTSTEEYYSTLFHELSHSTGHSRRLNRGLDTAPKPYGTPDYGKEELIAEMSAAFLNAEAGIKPAVIENQAAYISGWLGQIKQDKKLVIWAAAAGQRAADYILGIHRDTEAEGHESGPESMQADAVRVVVQKSVSLQSRQGELEQAARNYIRRGFAPVPIPAGQKAPALKDWTSLQLREQDVGEAFHGTGNLGLILGPASGNLVDVDLDCPEAREFAGQFLPPTDAITGRPSSPRSHWWYYCPNIETTRHRDPVTKASIVELRGIGSQTLVGPSIHPSSEPYDFLQGEPAQVGIETLRQAVEQLAAEVIRVRHGEIPIRKFVPTRTAPPPEFASVNREHLLRRASAYLNAMPPAMSGSGGHNATFAAATALVHGFCLSETEALDLLRNHYNPKCQPPWSDKELEHKVIEAANRSHKRQLGWLIHSR